MARFMDQLKPEEIAGWSFRHTFRGADPAEVSEFLAQVARQLEELIAQRDRLAGRLGEFAERDLKTEFSQVGAEVSAVLETARLAAEAMRDRAATDAARWRSDALTDATAVRRSAEEDAEHLRTDAWHAAETLLRQVQIEERRLAEAAERDALSVLGEAEREAHRLTAAARREAEDMVRMARMEAERLHADATARHDETIEGARRQAESAQERARALEQRRQELLTELEGLRSSMSRIEGELDERKSKLDIPATEASAIEPPARIVRPEKVEQQNWEPGETVRVLPRRKGSVAGPELADSDQLVEEVRRLRKFEPLVGIDEPMKAPQPIAEPAAAAPIEESMDGVEKEHEVPEPELIMIMSPTVEVQVGDEVGVIFSRLKGQPPAPSVPDETASPPPVERRPRPSPAFPPLTIAPLPRTKPLTDTDPLEVRERLLLPVTNRALRNMKRQLTEIQNVALEQLRVAGTGWHPQLDAMEEQLRPDLLILMSESFSMGHAAAEELVGKGFSRPPTPARDDARAMTAVLVDQLQQVVNGSPDEAGRELGAALSRVFRAWRTDEVDRRISDLASSAYHQGMRATLSGGHYPMGWVVSGRGCGRCRQAAEQSATESGEPFEDGFPPLHPGCGCTLIPRGV